ncbi:hypothetical protein D5086_017017 [Populus alba]|uniref:Uncharacterized protein n=1 Tax=Populus alba TaxID=43335 RepID=A0ACC4BW65_POPAL
MSGLQLVDSNRHSAPLTVLDKHPFLKENGSKSNRGQGLFDGCICLASLLMCKGSSKHLIHIGTSLHSNLVFLPESPPLSMASGEQLNLLHRLGFDGRWALVGWGNQGFVGMTFVRPIGYLEWV